MATTFVEYTGDGNATKQFTFPSLQESDVKVRVDGVLKTTSTHYNITSYTTTGGGNVVFTSGNIPSSPANIRIYRDTNVDTAKATYTAGSSVKAADLNNNNTQLLYRSQEEQIPNLIHSYDIDASAIETSNVKNDAITSDKIADDQINSEHYAAGSIDLEHMSANSVDSDQYVDGSIDRVHLAADIVDGTKIADDSINSEHYVDQSIDTQHIANLNITTAKIANSNVTTAKIADLNVTTGKIADLAITTGKIADGAITDDKIQGGSLDNRYYTETELDAGQLDNRYFTETELTNGALDGRYFTETEADARYFNISTGDTIKDGDTFPDNDTTIATTAAINDRIIDLVDDVGGFVPIANETSFPTANPDVNNGSGTLVSVKAISSTRTPSSGTVTIANGAGTGNTVTITGCGSTVLTAGFGIIVETTSTLHTYAFHRLVPKATEVTTVASISSNVTTVATNIADINTVANDLNEATSEIDTVATNITNVNTVGNAIGNVNTTAGSIANVNTTATNIANVNTTAGSISNVNTVAGSIASVNTASSNINSIANFGDQYQVASSAPSNDGGGNALAAGDLYFDTSSNELRVYNGSAWQGGVTAGTGFAGTGSNTFTGNQTIQNTAPTLFLTDTNANSDYSLVVNGGEFRVRDETNSANRFYIEADGTSTFTGNLNVSSGLDVTGNITVTGNVDGRDIAADGGSLDSIEQGNIGTNVTNGNVKLTPNGTGVVEVRGAGGYDGTLQLNCSAQSHGIKLKSPPHSAAQSYTLTFPSSLTNNGVLATTSSGGLSASLLTNANVDASAAIAGTKISPDFGSQTVTTTGTVNTGLINASSASDQILNLNSSDSGAVYLAFKRSGGRKAYFGYGGTGNTISLVNEVSDGDIVISGNDGGSSINMLSFNTSENGKATFIGNVHCSELRPSSHLVMNSADNQIIYLGASNDVQLYHSGSNTFFTSSTGDLIFNSGGTGSTVFRSRFDSTVFANAADNQNQLVLDQGIAKLYAAGNEKFRTSSTGGTLTGNLAVTGETSTTDIFLSDSILHNGDTDTKIRFPSADIFTVETGGSERFRVTTDKVMLSVDLKPDTDSARDLGTSSNRFANGYFDTLYGDGSNLTGVSSAEIYGFNTDANGNLIVTTTNGGADNISGSTFDAFEDVVFAATGISFSLDSSGDLIATIS